MTSFGLPLGAAELDLPPPYRLVSLREAGDAFAHAQIVAGELGGGTVVWVRRFDLAEFAVVLEPEEPLATARRAFYAGMTALADTLAAFSPPEKPMRIDWPGGLRFDGALIGGGRLAEPAGIPEGSVPPWLVFGAVLRTQRLVEIAPGMQVIGSALEQEGFDEVDAGRLVESFARHLMVAFDEWIHDGFKTLAGRYLARLPDEPGLRRGIDPNGDLLLRRTGRGDPVARRNFVEALRAEAWRDPETGEPRS